VSRGSLTVLGSRLEAQYQILRLRQANGEWDYLARAGGEDYERASSSSFYDSLALEGENLVSNPLIARP
jgi:hypothetical protein